MHIYPSPSAKRKVILPPGLRGRRQHGTVVSQLRDASYAEDDHQIFVGETDMLAFFENELERRPRHQHKVPVPHQASGTRRPSTPPLASDAHSNFRTTYFMKDVRIAAIIRGRHTSLPSVLPPATTLHP
ncbi:hypothetical protein EVG20_g3711 [Dentipellis fragilis]|uniref:Uncharacterized protein n=1 Tax=Dentipellis fragilis TaxID=205917 RepID=A0A4Y9Z075_9AGAM|nr:hypothetical protein EVG20_g3711 [Dentipellis fragilis]